MNESNVTTKGTVTIPAKFRKQFGIDNAKKVRFNVNHNGELVISPTISMEEFAKRRDIVMAKVNIPDHLKGLSGDALREVAAKAWSSSES